MRQAPRTLFALAALLPLLTVRADAAQSYAERVRETLLPNGLKVLLLEDHKAPTAVIQVWYRVGSRNESLGKTGLAHLLEHLMFKGTAKTGPEEYSRIVQRNGGNDNAFTSDDNTTYFAQIASDRLPVVIDLEADRMQNLAFDDSQFGPEHRVVIEERRLRTEDSPVSALFEIINATAYVAHPYQWPTIGWMRDLEQATRTDALAFYREHYTPGNAFVVCAGDFSADDILAHIESTFGKLPAGPPPAPVRALEPAQDGERRVVLRREAQLPFVDLAYHVPNLDSRDAVVLEVLAAVLGGGKSARLERHLVHDQRLAREVGSSYDLTSVDPGLFHVYAQPLPGKTTDRLEQALRGEIRNLQTKPVGARELETAKNGLESSFILAQDSLFYQAMMLGQYEMAGGWRRIDSYVDTVRAVAAEDIERVAAAYLRPENSTVGTLVALPLTAGKHVPAAGLPQGVVH